MLDDTTRRLLDSVPLSGVPQAIDRYTYAIRHVRVMSAVLPQTIGIAQALRGLEQEKEYLKKRLTPTD